MRDFFDPTPELDRVTGSDPSVTDYVLEVPARCLQCGSSDRFPVLQRAPFMPKLDTEYWRYDQLKRKSLFGLGGAKHDGLDLCRIILRGLRPDCTEDS